jgi:putative ABC transport system ATP-binding protein
VTTTPALRMTKVTKRYQVGDTTITALDGADLEVEPGEIVALLGPSGSGKTTLCSLAGGILTPTDGEVVVAGTDISDFTAKRLTDFRRDEVGFVFQSVNLVPFLTARENLLVVDELGRRDRRDRRRARERADRLLADLALDDRAANLPAQLSGGQRQRVAIGRALMNEPALVLLDEPTSALDSTLGEQVMELVQRQIRDRGTAAIVVTHDERVVRFADRTIHISDGRLAA